jgi:hypothetical protein
MKKIYYLLTEKNFIGRENGKNVLDLGVFIEKIVLSTESEDFKVFSENTILKTKEDIFRCYVDLFMLCFSDMLFEERKKSDEEEFQIYNHLLMDEEQFTRILKPTIDVPIREVSVFELSEN